MKASIAQEIALRTLVVVLAIIGGFTIVTLIGIGLSRRIQTGAG